MSESDRALLSTVQRGFAVAAARALGERAEAACAHRWPAAPALPKHARLLASSPERLAAEASELDAPRPAGLLRVHPSWYEAPSPSARSEAHAWLERRAFGHLVPMPPPSTAAATGNDAVMQRLEAMEPELLERIVERLGIRRVAIAFSGATQTQLAQLCARLGEPAATALLDEVRQVSSQVTREQVKSEQRALFQVGVDSTGDTPRTLFFRVGAARLSPTLATRGGDRLRRLAQRLPRPAGRLLVAAATVPATDAELAATWAQLALLVPRS